MINQNIGIGFLIPIEITKLEKNILVRKDLYPGDLLNAILRIDKKYWETNSIKYELERDLVEKNIELITNFPNEIQRFLRLIQ